MPLSPVETRKLRLLPRQDERFDGHCIHRMEIANIADWTTLTALDYEEGEPVNLTKPLAVFGHPADPSCLNGVADSILRASPKAIHAIPDGRIVGWSAIVDRDHRLYHSEFGSAAGVSKFTDHDGFVLSADYELTFIGLPCAKEHRQTALFLPYREPGNYGAFLVRALPLLMFVASVELPSFEIVSRGVV